MKFNVALLGRNRTDGYLASRSTIIPKPCQFFDLEPLTRSAGETRYDIDFLETLDWTTELLDTKLEIDVKEFIPLRKPIIVMKTDYYSVDFTKPPKEKEEKIGLVVDEMKLSKAKRHGLLVLAGKRFDPLTGLVIIKKGEIEKFLDTVKEEEGLEKIVLNLSHVKPRRAALKFPSQWLIPNVGKKNLH